MNFTSRPREALSEENRIGDFHVSCTDIVGYSKRLPVVQDKGPPKAQAHTGGPFLRFSAFYFGTGSDAKFAWTNTQLLSFFTKTRVDFARPGSVFPSLPMVRPI